jgi:hypothetical protein
MPYADLIKGFQGSRQDPFEQPGKNEFLPELLTDLMIAPVK